MKEYINRDLPDEKRTLDYNILTHAFVLTIPVDKYNAMKEICRYYYNKDDDDIVHFMITCAIDQYLISRTKSRLEHKRKPEFHFDWYQE